MTPFDRRLAQLPVFYGWVLVAVGFVTMAIGVNARTAFSLLFPPILDEFAWDRGVIAGSFSFGFLVSAIFSPIVGRLMDLRGPRTVVEIGTLLLGAGLLCAVLVSQPWQLYLTLGVLVGGGTNCLGYTVQSLFLTNWFVRRRALALSIAFAGVGVGSAVLFPWLQVLIATEGWRTACWALGLLTLAALLPLNLLLRKRPQDLGLLPDGDRAPDANADGTAAGAPSNVVDAEWVAVEWTLGKAIRTARFWWLGFGYFCGLYAWYAVQVHQTRYLIDVGFSPLLAAWALGLVSLVAIPGQIYLGHLSDRIGREGVWSIGCAGFAATYLSLLLLKLEPSPWLLYLMVGAQGLVGYTLATGVGPILAEIFEGPNFGTIFGTVMLASIAGGAVGPWVTGALFDLTGNYVMAFWIAILLCLLSALAIWIAAPRKVRLVAGQVGRTRR